MRQLTAIFAQSKNGVIGNNGTLPWYCPEELIFFRETTEYHTVLLGRKTMETVRKLRNRDSIVVSNNPELGVPLWKALYHVDEELDFFPGKEVFVIGGAGIFMSLMPRISKLIITTLDIKVEGDTLNPFNMSHWELKTSINHHGQIPFVVNTYNKKLVKYENDLVEVQ